jgi:hypothetical protein
MRIWHRRSPNDTQVTSDGLMAVRVAGINVIEIDFAIALTKGFVSFQNALAYGKVS